MAVALTSTAISMNHSTTGAAPYCMVATTSVSFHSPMIDETVSPEPEAVPAIVRLPVAVAVTVVMAVACRRASVGRWRQR